MAYEWYDTAFADTTNSLGQKGSNGVPDILDEARWGLEWIHRLHPTPGQLIHQVADDRDHVGFKMPDNDPSDYGWGPNSYRAAYFATGGAFTNGIVSRPTAFSMGVMGEAGPDAIMPLASLIGSGMGILNPWNLSLIIEQAKVPVLVDAGVGTASDAAIAMELGCDGVLMNTAIAGAKDPIRMARAMKLAIEAGREAFLAGRIPRRFAASPSSPMAGRVA